jgi:hypothetical protein
MNNLLLDDYSTIDMIDIIDQFELADCKDNTLLKSDTSLYPYNKVRDINSIDTLPQLSLYNVSHQVELQSKLDKFNKKIVVISINIPTQSINKSSKIITIDININKELYKIIGKHLKN